MSLKDSFNNTNYEFHKVNESTLRIRFPRESMEYRFDFALRLLTVRSGEALSTQPFSQVDREVLIEVRDKLVQMAGKPPELPPEAPVAAPPPRRLNP